MPKVFKHKALMLGLVFAAVGFSYSQATRDAQPRAVLIGGGQVGVDNGNLRFTNVFINNPNNPYHVDPSTIPPNIPIVHPSGHADPTNYPDGGDDEADPDGFDLGDAEYTFDIPPGNPRVYQIIRYLTATGGVPPYRFTSTSLPLGDNMSTLLLDDSGRLHGTVRSEQQTGGVDDVLRVQCRVTDSAGTIRNGQFYLFLFDPSDPLSPATFDITDTVISNGTVGLSYVSKLQTILGDETETGSPAIAERYKPNGGKIHFLLNDGNHPLSRYWAGTPLEPPTNYPVRVFRDDEPLNPGPFAFPRLEDIGLTLNHDGTIHGRPIFSGRIEIDVLAFDGRVFPPPTPQFVERIVTLRVAANDKYANNTTYNVGQVASDLSIRSCVIRTEDTPTENNHSFTMTALFNPNGQFAKVLRRQQIMNIRFGQMDYEFEMRNEPVGMTLSGGPNDGTKISASINEILGRMKIDIQKGRFTWPFNSLLVPPNNPKRIVVSVGIGHMWQTAEVLHFDNRRSGIRSILTYKFGNTQKISGVSGKIGTVNRSLGGTFMLTFVRGKNGLDVAGAPASRWFVRGICAPRLTIDNPGAVTDPSTPDGGNDTILAMPTGGGRTSGLDNIQSGQVRIGSWSQFWTVLDRQAKVKASPVRTVIKFPSLSAGIKMLMIDNKRFTFKLVTHPIAGTLGFPQTGIPQGDRGLEALFTFGLDLFRTDPTLVPNTAFDFHGETGKLIRGDVGTWFERPPGKAP